MIIVMQIIILLHKEEYYQKYNIIIYDEHRISDMIYKRETCVGRYIYDVCSFYSLTLRTHYIYIYIYMCEVCVCAYSMVFFVKIPEKNILIVLIHGALILQMKKNKREF